MYVVIGGAGEVGYHVARALRREGHSVALIEQKKEVLEGLSDLDALLVQGNTASLESLEEAGISKADLFVGASGNDEANMVACGIAKTFGASTISRINSPAFLDEPASTKYRKIGIDVAVCPELVAAQRVNNLLLAPALASADIFAQGRVAVVESKLLPNSPAAGKRLAAVKPPAGVNVVAILRGPEVIIPRGEDMLEAGDRLLLCVVSPDALQVAEKALGLRPGKPAGKIKRAVIAGASRVGVRLARLLEDRMDVVLIEKSRDLATDAFERVKDTLVITGDATDLRVLKSESVETADVFIGADRVEEYNLLSALMARRLGVRHTIAFVNQVAAKPVVEDVGIDLALTVRETTASSLLRFCYQIDALDLSILAGGEAQVLEVQVPTACPIAGKPLKKIDFPRNSLVGALVRGKETLLPRGDDLIQAGDRLIIFALTEAVPRIERLLRK